MRKIILLISSVLVLGIGNTVFAAEQKEKEEELVFLGELPELPKDIKNYIKPFIIGQGDFVTEAEKVKGLAGIDKEFRALVIELLKNRFFEHKSNAQTELVRLSEDGRLSPFALAVLLEAGAKVNGKDWFNKTALIEAIKKGRTKIVDMLIENGADPNQKDMLGETALIVAAGRGYANIVEMLIKKGADPNKKNSGNDTALIEAAGSGHANIVDMLIKNGADPNEKNNHANTALIEATNRGHADVIEMLIKKGVNPDQKGEDGNTALIVAVKKGYANIADMLIKNGADPNQKNRHGETALDLVKRFGRTEIAKILKEAIEAEQLRPKKITTLLEKTIKKQNPNKN